ncbi:hypothetical protein LguiA_004320 [Lonicera macranthoides]
MLLKNRITGSNKEIFGATMENRAPGVGAFSVCSSEKLLSSSKFILHDVCRLSAMVTHMNSKRKS